MVFRGVVMLTGPTWAGGHGRNSAGPSVAGSHGAGFCLRRIRPFTRFEEGRPALAAVPVFRDKRTPPGPTRSVVRETGRRRSRDAARGTREARDAENASGDSTVLDTKSLPPNGG